MNKNILIAVADQAYAQLLSDQVKSLSEVAGEIVIIPDVQAADFAPGTFDLILAAVADNTHRFSEIATLKKRFPGTPVIALLIEGSPFDEVDAIRQGAHEILTKGKFDQQQLKKSIWQAIARINYLSNIKNRLNEHRLHFENGPIPMWIIDNETKRFLLVNRAAVEKYGYSSEEFNTMTIADIRPADEVAAMLEVFHRSVSSHYFDAGYWRHKKKNGELFFVHVYTHQTSFDNADARLCFVVDVNEKLITDQENKRLLAQIQHQKAELDSILSSINDAIWSRDAETYELLYGNRAYYELYGFVAGKNEPEKALDMNAIHPDDRAGFRQAINEVKTKGYVDYTYRHIGKEGETKVLNGKATLKKGIDGKPDTIDGITVDITREKELYDTIRNSEQKLLATINNTKDLIWSVDRDLKIIHCNRAYQDFFYKKFNVALDEGNSVIGPWHSDAFNEERRVSYARSLCGESFSTVVEETAGGETKYFEISSSPIVGVDERIIGVNCVSRDITEQANYLKRIRIQNDRLREIAWIQSHKVRGPVANILGLVQLFDEDGGNHKDIIAKLKVSTQQLDEIIREVVLKSGQIADTDAAG